MTSNAHLFLCIPSSQQWVSKTADCTVFLTLLGYLHEEIYWEDGYNRGITPFPTKHYKIRLKVTSYKTKYELYKCNCTEEL